MTKHERPLPIPHLDTKGFWEGCKRHELMIQRCKECDTSRFSPRPMCPECNSTNAEWIKVSGRGNIYSWIVVRDSSHRPVHPGLVKDRPYVVVLVELLDADGIRLISNLVDCNPEDVKMGMSVEVVLTILQPR